MHFFLTQEQTKKLLEYISDGVQIIDSGGVLVYCNRHSAMLDDININDSIGKHITEVYPSLKEEESTLLKVLQTKTGILNREQTYRNYKGKEITTLNTTLPILNGKTVEGAIEISRDITSYKELSERYMALQTTMHQRSNKVETEMPKAHFRFEDIVTEHAEFNRMKTIAMKAAPTDIPVLVYGETGTGKELLTQAIHNASKRQHRPFVAQNCAALPSSLLEGILFGTVKGGFTGALDRMGLFELADKGTLFLDEINSMPLELQAKLLRVLQDGKIRRIGDTKERKVDVRVIAATNVEPNKAIETGMIRRDLYYRLNTVSLWIPNLRDRREDIPILTQYFIKKYNTATYQQVTGVSSAVLQLFLHYPWEGNVRELEHVIEGAVTFAESRVIDIEDLPTLLRQYYFEHFESIEVQETVMSRMALPIEEGLSKAMEEAERHFVLSAYKACGENVSQTAKQLKIPRQTLQYKLKKILGDGSVTPL